MPFPFALSLRSCVCCAEWLHRQVRSGQANEAMDNLERVWAVRREALSYVHPLTIHALEQLVKVRARIFPDSPCC
jgi:hypothetical protein